VASIGGVAAAADPEGFPEPAFQTGPKAQTLEDGVEKFRDHTVVSGLGVRVVDRMMSGTLQDPQIMEKVYPRAVFAAAAVRPFVDLVGVSDQGGKEPDGGCEHAESPSGGDDQAGDEP
jgi:hypothetical protein